MELSLFVLGYPSEFGGADTELFHTVRLWRSLGLQVSLIPTWRADPSQKMKLDTLGAETIEVEGPQNLSAVPGLRGATVVSFCNGEFLKHASILHEMGCRLVWVNCMTWAFPAELQFHEKYGAFAAYVFQSQFQQDQLAPIYRKHGASEEQFHLIRGAFDVTEFTYAPKPHNKGEPFVMGRISRDDLDKWSSNLWPIYSSVQYSNKQARVMAWNQRLTAKCGPPPEWAQALTANSEPAAQFLRSLHCMFPINGGARENWPRAGLEAMALGVPVVAQNEWGWREMIEHGKTGFLGSDDCELSHYAALLAYDEELRLHIAENARAALVETLANPRAIGEKWLQLFHSLGVQIDSDNELLTPVASHT